jgi:hypothetical protein
VPKTKKSKFPERSPAEVVGEEVLKKLEKPKKASSDSENFKQPPKRKGRSRLGLGTELTPLVRRRDGTFTFRNRDVEKAKTELSRQRKECVRDSLFKYLDSQDSLMLQPKGSMTRL